MPFKRQWKQSKQQVPSEHKETVSHFVGNGELTQAMQQCFVVLHWSLIFSSCLEWLPILVQMSSRGPFQHHLFCSSTYMYSSIVNFVVCIQECTTLQIQFMAELCHKCDKGIQGLANAHTHSQYQGLEHEAVALALIVFLIGQQMVLLAQVLVSLIRKVPQRSPRVAVEALSQYANFEQIMMKIKFRLSS